MTLEKEQAIEAMIDPTVLEINAYLEENPQQRLFEMRHFEFLFHRHLWRNRDRLSDIAGATWNGTASLKIDNAYENLRLLNLNFINSETFFNFSCYETGQ